MKLWIATIVLAFLPQSCVAQTEQQLHTMPSSVEILELANKAEENVKGFEKALDASEPYLDKDTFQTDQDAANKTHAVISAIRKNGPSMYSLVGLLSALDDLTLDASRASRLIILAIGQNSLKDSSSRNAGAIAGMSLMNSENSLYDISDLILQVTLRYAAAENDLVQELLKKLK
jgi:hypothetical protein